MLKKYGNLKQQLVTINSIVWRCMVLYFVLALNFNLHASVSVYNNFIEGTSIKTSGMVEVFDQFYPDMLSNQANFTNKSVKGKVVLKYDEGDTLYFNEDWEIVVTFDLYKWDALGNMTTLTAQQLKINYFSVQPSNAQSAYNNISILEFFNSYMARVRITDVDVNGINPPFNENNIPSDIKLEMEIETERYLNFDYTASTDIWHESTYTLGDKYVDLKWIYMHGAEEYDLEWFFFSDKYNGTFTSPSNVSAENYSRVTVPNTHYRLELPYVKGTLIYRVRGVGRHGIGFAQRMEGAWTNQSGDRIQVGNIDENRNWKYECAYAEDGKRKENITYFDGTSRSRQSIIRNNTSQVSIISESFYDYEGRPALQTIAAPGYDDSQNQAHPNPPAAGGSRINRLEFYKNYSLNASGILFSKKDFDKQVTGNICQQTPAVRMHPANGAANYYSMYNPDLAGNFASFHTYIPDVDSLPFTQTVYDKEGRVSKTSSPDSTLALGGGKETSYDYATPVQTKLDRLFGNDVGYASHYSVKMVTDPNGQSSLSYANLSDKVIATSLIGEKPANLLQLNSNSTGTITSHFNHQNLYVPTEEGYIMRSKFLVESPGEHKFTYWLEPEVYYSICSGVNYNCVYDLAMTIFDKCEKNIYDGNQDPYESPSVKILHKGIQIVNNEYLQSTPLTFSVFFNKAGVYYLEKKLTLNQAALENHIDNLVASLPGSCIDDYESKLNDSLNLEGCLTCEEFCTAYPSLCEEDECDVQVTASCDALFKTLKEDMSPNGQYFEKNLGIETWMEKYLWPNIISDIRWMKMNFKDPNNNLISSWAALKLHWNWDGTDWATKQFSSTIITEYGVSINSLIEAHPEYCQYVQCTTLIESTKFTYKLMSMSLDQAKSAGYIPTTNPSQKCTTSTGTPIIYIGEEIIDDDYFFNTIATNYTSAMKDKMQAYDLGSSLYWKNACNISSSVSCLWELAISLVEKNNNCPGTPVGTDEEYWEMFKKLYIAHKDTFVNFWKWSEGCFYLCDATLPVPDDIADHTNMNSCDNFPPMFPNFTCPGTLSSCYDYINGFEIRVPYYQSFFDNVINSNDPEQELDDITDEFEDKVKCGKSAVGSFSISPYNQHPYESDPLSEFVSTGESISIIYSSSSTYCTSPPCTLQIASFDLDNTGTPLNLRRLTLFNQIKQGINNYTSTNVPEYNCDYTVNNNGDIAEFSIWCEEIGTLGNGSLIFSSGFNNYLTGSPYSVYVQTSILQNPSGGDTIPCPDDSVHCLCAKLTLLVDYANDEGIVDISAYLDDYITTNYPSISYTAGDAYSWYEACLHDMSLPYDPQYPLDIPGEILEDNLYCNPEEEPCENESYLLTSFYGSLFYQAAVQAEIEKFKKEYKEHCFALKTPNNFKEHFQVEYEDYEYHFTLYYYDQAGNLVHTVPPAGVTKLTQIAAQAADNYRITNSGSPVYPAHTFVTKYQYNTLNLLTKQKIPDAENIGLTSFSHKFFYDNIGRLKASQNSKQANTTPTKYSYTAYDAQNRIIEVGELLASTDPSSTILNAPNFPSNWVSAGSRNDITYTLYDTPYNSFISNKFLGGQKNLRNRVAATYLKNSDADANYKYATHYNYDIHGNVNELINECSEMPPFANAAPGFGQLYSVRYKYDLISGNVNEVNYQVKYADRYLHKYWYDADNRLQDVYTSKDNIIWDLDGQYQYYLHGPMARLEYGQQKVQGSDYAYSSLGWLKSVNGNRLVHTGNMGKDGVRVNNISNTPYYTNNIHLHHKVAMDAMAFSIHYFKNDYRTISQNTYARNFYSNILALNPTAGNQADLYNGNISHIAVALNNLLEDPMDLSASFYRYDQLNRIRNSYVYMSTNTTDYTNASNNGSYNTAINYDANGNINTLTRNGLANIQLSMDDLSYTYISGTNKLNYVSDAITTNPYTDDIKNGQGASNYGYDDIGNLIADAQEEINQIEWNTYGKIAKITRVSTSSKPDFEFRYNPSGNRTMKIEKPRVSGSLTTQDKWIYTHYVHDAQGNVMAIYKQGFVDKGSNTYESTYELSELPIYGSNRLGLTWKEAIWKKTFKATINGTTGLFVPYVAPVSLPSPLDLYKTWHANGTVTVELSEETVFEIYSHGYTVLKSADAFATLTIISGDAIQQGDSIILTAGTQAKISAPTDFTYYSDDYVEYKLQKNSNFVASVELSLIDLALNLNNNTSVSVGNKMYELTNHLGNVHTVVSDRKIPVDDGTYLGGIKQNSTPDGITDFFIADVVTVNDYYPFGSTMPGRTFNSGEYRYGMNGQEKDDEIVGSGNIYTAEFWQYDARLGRRWNTDPVIDPSQSPYACFNNNPIHYKDPDGDTPTDDKKPYKGGIQVFDAADAKGEVPGGQSKAVESFKVGDYDVLPNYITNEKGEEQFSHYTASIMVKQIKPTGGTEDVARIDYVFGQNDLSKFKENVSMFSGAANLMFGANLHLADWQIKQLNGQSWYGSYLKDQWTNPYNLLAGAHLMVAAMTPQPVTYAPRVRMRGVQDPVSHNFPYSFDQVILQSKPILKNNGYKIYQVPGTMHGGVKNGVQQIKTGVFEIGVTKDGVIDHRFFRPD